ncbi:N-acetyldiaminopimelate deacetylase [Lactobacillus sp. DCY120]|uniref:N-acetyldiaminopimelate deacetylase n=1 Tax=Bombilactobacillus apium TaxID=2675299 RepID=A0A850R890_9LACO|nr:N-acetyldiaminopimelate deacetylase [Bombilactobacillus apium]NVY95616.1 N-acetyldiaminopimelate deacetylase [Bombilactobacillus apium]
MLTEKELIQIRRQLHQIPELALQEKQTCSYLKEIIARLPQSYLSLKTLPQLPTALLVRVQGRKPHRTIGYRADIDALPVKEETDLEFASQHEGLMHACGHDLHMTVALGILSYYSEHQPQDNLVFFFQPAEESESGGQQAYEQGAFTGEFQVDEIYALHDTPQLPAGLIGCRLGTLFAGTTEVDVDFLGQGGHAAYPQRAKDMIVAAAAFIEQVQTIISRNVDPIEGGVITFGKLRAGTIRNVIAGEAHLEGTIRGLTQKMIELIDTRLQTIAAGIGQSFEAQVQVHLRQGGYWPVENNPRLTQKFIQQMQADPQVKYQETQPAMTGEDFGYLIAQIPGTMFWLGVGETGALHSSTFNPDERAIEAGVHAVISYLQIRMQEEEI